MDRLLSSNLRCSTFAPVVLTTAFVGWIGGRLLVLSAVHLLAVDKFKRGSSSSVDQVKSSAASGVPTPPSPRQLYFLLAYYVKESKFAVAVWA